MQKHYDYIISGAGAAGLSLLMRLLKAENISHKQILLIDHLPKNQNDRTWCFWEQGSGFFESVVFRKWNQFYFHASGFSKQFPLAPYQYKMIRGIDFYQYCFEQIQQFKNVTIVYKPVSAADSNETTSWIEVEGEKITADYVFNSIIWEKPVLQNKEYYLLQHFKGWLIETPEPVFDIHTPVFMDFRVPQHHGTSFAYVLPFSATKALVEYTLFTANLLPASAYEEGLQQYLQGIAGIKNYQILEEEFGIIPMTNHRFSPGKQRLIQLGTAGGKTKASSGYTFQFIQKHTAAIVKALANGADPLIAYTANDKKFLFYDTVLLHILQKGSVEGATIFSTLFQKNDARKILRFLDNESNLIEDIRIIKGLPTLPFLKAALKSFHL